MHELSHDQTKKWDRRRRKPGRFTFIAHQRGAAKGEVTVDRTRVRLKFLKENKRIPRKKIPSTVIQYDAKEKIRKQAK